MPLKFTIRKIIPFVLIYAALIISAAALHLFFHSAGYKGTLRYLGIIGSVLILLSFVYSLRKRKIINLGKAKLLL